MPRPATQTTLLAQRLLPLLKAMPAAAAGDVTSLHRARVASRRLRAALPVLAAAADHEALGRAKKHVRRITRALGPVREMDVALGHFDEFAGPAGLSPRATAAVRASFTAERDRRRRAMIEAISPVALEKLKRSLTAAGRAVRAVDRPAEIAQASRRAARRAEALEGAIDRAGALYLPERLHQVRIAAKQLRYALEVERDLRRSRAVSRLRVLKALQDRLGRLHDLEVLAERLRGVQAGLLVSDRPAARELDRLIAALDQACREDHAAYMRERAAVLAVAGLVREAARSGRSTVAA